MKPQPENYSSAFFCLKSRLHSLMFKNCNLQPIRNDVKAINAGFNNSREKRKISFHNGARVNRSAVHLLMEMPLHDICKTCTRSVLSPSRNNQGRNLSLL